MKQIKKIHKYNLKFDSRLELYFYELLKSNDIRFGFQVPYEIHPSFKYNNTTVRAMTLTVDFDLTDYGTNVIVDTKGFQRNDNKLKWKLLKYGISDIHPHIFLPKNHIECIKVLEFIKKL